MRSKSPAKIYETEILDMDPNLERGLLRVLSNCNGKNNAIPKRTKPGQKIGLLQNLRSLGFGNGISDETFERQVRACIVGLRKRGYLICSSSGEGGYYIASSIEEYEEFAQVEYRAKIIDMSETLHAMDEGARGLFGTEQQLGLGF